MPPTVKPPTSIRRARIFVRSHYSPSPLQTKFAPERSLPSTDTPIQARFDEASGSLPPPPSVHDSAAHSQIAKVPKPTGEVGRPGRGGYSLEDALNWPAEVYAELQANVRKLTDRLPRVLPEDEKEDTINTICRQVRRAMPVLERYTDDWPTRDYLHGHLKNRQTRSSKKNSPPVDHEPSPDTTGNKQPEKKKKQKTTRFVTPNSDESDLTDIEGGVEKVPKKKGRSKAGASRNA